MRLPILHGVRPLADYEVDRPEVYARQRVQPTGTNRPRTWLLLALAIGSTGSGMFVPWARTLTGLSRGRPGFRSNRPGAVATRPTVSAAMAEGRHPVPFRTRKLSPPAPMVLPW